MKKYILALDQGTTSSRALLFDEKAALAGISRTETRQIFPRPGWVEQDAMEIWENQKQAALGVMRDRRVEPEQIAAIGITNQRETTVLWNRTTGKPVGNAIIWQDKRTAPICEQMKAGGKADFIRKKTGLLPDSYFSASKLIWMLENIDGARKLAMDGDLCFGTIDSWLIWNLSGGTMHVTDYSNASRTLLYNIVDCCWDEDLLSDWNIPVSLLPAVVSSSSFVCNTHPDVFGAAIPVTGIAGDQQASLYGHHCLQPGMAKNTYGTGCFLLMNTGAKPVFSKHGLLTTIAWNKAECTEYALEGSVFVAGALIKWLRDGLGLISSAVETESLALAVNDNAGVYIVPAFAGLGAPWWNMDAKGLICGLSLGTKKEHIVRAALESMAFQTADLLKAMEADSGIVMKSLRVDGGAASNNFLLQFQCGLLGIEVKRPGMIETTAFGAACLAAESAGFWNEQLYNETMNDSTIFNPSMTDETRQSLMQGWQHALKKCLH